MISRFSCLLLLLVSCFSAKANNIDSLIQVFQKTKSISIKVSLAQEIAEGLVTRNPPNAIQYCDIGIELIRGGKKDPFKADFLKIKGTAYFYLNELDSTKKYWLRSVEWIPERDIKRKADGLNNLGIYFKKTGDLDRSLDYFKQSLLLRLKLEDEVSVAKSYNNLASLNRKKGNLIEAIDYYASALVLYEKHDLKKEIADALTGLALIHKGLKNSDAAISFLNDADGIYQSIENIRGHANVANNLGAVYLDRGEDSLAEKYFMEFCELSVRSGNATMSAGVQINLAILYRRKGELDKSIQFYQDALIFYESKNDLENMALIQNNLGQLYQSTGEAELGISCYSEAIKNAKRTGAVEVQKNAHKGLSNLLRKKKQFEAALESITAYTILQDSLASIELNDKVAKYQELYEAEKRDKEIRQLRNDVFLQEEKARTDRLYRNWLVVFSIMLMCLLVLGYNRFKLKRKVLMQKAQIIEDKKEEYRLKSELATKEIEEKNRELSSLTAHAMSKNKLLHSLSESLKSFDITSKEKLEQAILSFGREIKKSFDLDRDWEEFQRHFSNVHPNFFAVLSDRFSKLSPNDLRICAYLRMNLSTKEISTLMNIAPKSARMNRYRLKKKLQLQEEDSLQDFIMKL